MRVNIDYGDSGRIYHLAIGPSQRSWTALASGSQVAGGECIIPGVATLGRGPNNEAEAVESYSIESTPVCLGSESTKASCMYMQRIFGFSAESCDAISSLEFSLAYSRDASEPTNPLAVLAATFINNYELPVIYTITPQILTYPGGQ